MRNAFIFEPKYSGVFKQDGAEKKNKYPPPTPRQRGTESLLLSLGSRRWKSLTKKAVMLKIEHRKASFQVEWSLLESQQQMNNVKVPPALDHRRLFEGRPPHFGFILSVHV